MSSALPILGALALAACGFVGAPAVLGATAVRIPWDAGRLGPSASAAERLVRRPVDAALRLQAARGAPSRIPVPTALALLRSVERWGRGQPSVCLDAAEAAWALWRTTRDPVARDVGDALLLRFLRRTPGEHVAGVLSWMRNGDPAADPRAVFGSLPPDLAALVGSKLAEHDPDAGWDLMVPALRDASRPVSDAESVLRGAIDLARRRRKPADLGVLRAAAARPGLDPALRAEVERLARDLGEVR